jgi:hypothetical protein
MTTKFWAIFIKELHDLCYPIARFNKNGPFPLCGGNAFALTNNL